MEALDPTSFQVPAAATAHDVARLIQQEKARRGTELAADPDLISVRYDVELHDDDEGDPWPFAMPERFVTPDPVPGRIAGDPA
jgi:hypothetical protein